MTWGIAMILGEFCSIKKVLYHILHQQDKVKFPDFPWKRYSSKKSVHRTQFSIDWRVKKYKNKVSLLILLVFAYVSVFFLLQITQFLYNKKMNNPNISDKLVLIMLLVVKLLSASNFEYIFYSPLSLSSQKQNCGRWDL